MNILIHSYFNKPETEECLINFVEGLDDYKTVFEIYFIGGDTESSDVILYDKQLDGVVFDKLIVFTPQDLPDQFFIDRPQFDKIEVIDCLPTSWQNTPSSRIKKNRLEDLGNFFYLQKEAVFQCRPEDMTLIAGKVLTLTRKQIAGAPLPEVYWRCSLNNMVHFTGEEFLSFAEAAEQFVEATYMNSWGIMLGADGQPILPQAIEITDEFENEL